MNKDRGNEKAEWIGRAVFEKSFLTTGERVDRCARVCLVMMMQLPVLLSSCSESTADSSCGAWIPAVVLSRVFVQGIQC